MKPDSRLSRYRSRSCDLLRICQAPEGHDTYEWVGQNGKVELLRDVEDFHLINIYRILKKSDDYFSNLPIDSDTFDAYSENVTRLHHVEYELSVRGVIMPKFELYKTITVKTVFELLQMGCQIQFPNGYVIKGDPETKYIETKFVVGDELLDDGLRNLSEEGTVEAIEDAMKYNQEDEI
jgi:hypothetical protein